MRSRSRSKQVRQSSGSSGSARSPASDERVAPGASNVSSSSRRSARPLGTAGRRRQPGRRSGAGPIRACESAWARRTGPE